MIDNEIARSFKSVAEVERLEQELAAAGAEAEAHRRDNLGLRDILMRVAGQLSIAHLASFEWRDSLAREIEAAISPEQMAADRYLIEQVEHDRDAARDEVEAWRQRFSQQGDNLAAVCERYNAARAELEELNEALAGLRELMPDCWRAIAMACLSEDGLDCSVGIPLMERIEAVSPEAKALEQERQRLPVT